MASISAHKIYGLKGSGVLIKKQHVQLAELFQVEIRMLCVEVHPMLQLICLYKTLD